MKIGIVASGFDMLPLFRFLSKYDHEYHIFRDSKYGPWGDKSSTLKDQRLKIAIEYFVGKVDMIIVDPVAELRIKTFCFLKNTPTILPLFEIYFRNYVLKYSLVGKLGLLCDHVDVKKCHILLKPFIKTYIPTINQKNIRKFNKKFPIWKKEVRMWKYFLTTYGTRDWMVRNTIKHDLRYFRDANVDTIVPMSRGFLFYDKILQGKLNWKKIRFHGMNIVEDCFLKILQLDKFKIKVTEKKYSVTIHYTDSIDILLKEKKWIWMLERGKTFSIKTKKI